MRAITSFAGKCLTYNQTSSYYYTTKFRLKYIKTVGKTTLSGKVLESIKLKIHNVIYVIPET